MNINHLRLFNREFADGLLKDPVAFVPAFDKALTDIILAIPGFELGERSFSIGLEGSFGDHSLSPAKLSAINLGSLVAVQGIVTRCSLVRPKVVKSVHYCEKTAQFHAREYRDQTHLGHQLPTGSIYPKEDESGNPLTTEFGLSVYRGTQTISIQEMPERAPAGQLPHPVDVILDNDLADAVKAGDRVEIVGVYRSLGKHAVSTSAMFKYIFFNLELLFLQITLNNWVKPSIVLF